MDSITTIAREILDSYVMRLSTTRKGKIRYHFTNHLEVSAVLGEKLKDLQRQFDPRSKALSLCHSFMQLAVADGNNHIMVAQA